MLTKNPCLDGPNPVRPQDGWRGLMRLSKVICVIGTAFLCSADSVPKYGSNPAVGKTFTHNGVRLYYEVYGAGEPLLLVYGNGGSIAGFRVQIDYFSKRYTRK